MTMNGMQLGANTQTLLVADRNEEMLRLLERAGASRGFRVRVARGEDELIALAHEARPEAVIIDVDLPGVGGIALCRMLRDAPLTQETPIILRSGRWLSSETLRSAIDAGAADCIARTCPIDALFDRINGHIAPVSSKAALDFPWTATAIDELRTLAVRTVREQVAA